MDDFSVSACSQGLKKTRICLSWGAGKVVICMYGGGMESCQFVCPRGNLKHIPHVHGKAGCMSQGPS